MGMVLALILQLVKLCIIGFAVAVQGSKGFVISPSPGSLHVDPSPSETPSLLPLRESWRTIAPNSPAVPNGSFLHPPVTLRPPTSTPHRIKGVDPSISPGPGPSSLTLSPPFKAVPSPSTGQGNVPPSVQPSPPQRQVPVVRPPVFTATAPAPVAIHYGNLPENPPVSQPSEHGSFPPKADARIANKSNPPEPVSPAPIASQPTEHGSLPPKVDTGNANKSHTPEPVSPAPVAVPSANLPKISPVSQPTEHGSLAPKVDERNANRSHTPEAVSPASLPNEHGSLPPTVDERNANNISTPEVVSPAPVAVPSTNLPNISPVNQPNEHGSLPPKVDERNVNKSHTPEPLSPAPVAVPPSNLPKLSPASQPTEHGSFPPTVDERNANNSHMPEAVSPAPVAVPSTNLPKISPVNQRNEHGSLPPKVDERNANKGHTPEPLSPASIVVPSTNLPKISPISQPAEHGSLPPKVQTPEATPSILPAPATSPRSASPVNPPSVHPVIPAVSRSKLPVVSPALTPSKSCGWKNGREPVSAPSYKTPKPLPAIVHSPSQAPAAHKAKQYHHASGPLILSPKSRSYKEYHSPASPPSTSFYEHHHTRNIITSPAPASSYLVSPPKSKHQDQPIPPSLLPTSGRRHQASPPMNPVTQASPAPSPSFKTSPHPTKIPFLLPKESPSESSSKSPKTPARPRVQALPPPPPNEDCLSTVCSEPYANSPPGGPCRCVLAMQVCLRLSISLYTFFPLVPELASEIATGVFMKQSQVRIMGANAESEQLDKTVALIDLVPLGESFDDNTAFLTSERFWHKQVAIKASYFGDYDVLYVTYPGLPPSPPLPPSITMIDGGPYSNNGNNGRSIKPLGVDVQKTHHKGGLSRGITAIIALSVFLAVVLCSAAAWILFKWRDHESQPTSTPRVLPPSHVKLPGTAAGSSVGGGLGSASSSFRSSIAAHAGSAKTFSMNDMERATDNFHASRILGEGGFGRVYSGFLEDGTKVAVKVLKREDHHGDREFLSEVEMLSRLHHRNLVKLIGICTEDSFRCLVYELIPNGSVESHLHGVDRESSPLDWSARLKIALGAARGLSYLHEDSSPRVIHRDFKSSNILLEDDFTPKVSDFGLARTATDEESRHISTRVMGTFGYVAPEYAMTGHLLVKSDVYSYGVVLLELLTGRKPVDMSQPPGQENLVAWARPLLTGKEGLVAIIDPSLGTDMPFDSVAKVAAIASMCVQPEVSDRPFMGEVVQALKLVCNECDEAKEEAGSLSSRQEDISVDMDSVSEQPPHNIQSQFSATNYDSRVDIETGLAASELFSASVTHGRRESESFRRHSYSGPLRTGRSQRLWQIIRNLSGGSVSEHGTMFKL